VWLWAPPPALAQRNLNVYCRAGLTLKGSGETLAQSTAEAATVSPTVRWTWPFDAPLAPGATIALTVAGHGITLIRP